MSLTLEVKFAFEEDMSLLVTSGNLRKLERHLMKKGGFIPEILVLFYLMVL